jgi:hypothetical protein
MPLDMVANEDPALAAGPNKNVVSLAERQVARSSMRPSITGLTVPSSWM